MHLETLDGHRASQVFSITHVCGSSVVPNLPHTYEIPLENVRGGYYVSSSADLRNKP